MTIDMDRVKRCFREICDNINKIKQIQDHKMLIDCTTYAIEENLKIIFDEIVKLTKCKEYFEKLRTLCAKFSDCSNCPLCDYKKEFTTKCKGGFTLNYNNFSPDELLDAYNYCKKY